MTRGRTTNRSIQLAAAAAAAALLMAGLSGTARGDDKDLLRTTGAVPYVFFLLDTSSSMNADFQGNPLAMNGEDPRSKMYIAKKQLYRVFLGSTDFHYGFAFYNQDRTRVSAKHWLYAPGTPGESVQWTDSSAGVTFTWPRRVDLPALVDEDGNPLEEADQTESRSLAASDAWVFGPLFAGLVSQPTPDDPGGCNDPFDLSDPVERRKADRFPRVFGTGTGIWVEAGGQLYKVEMSKPVVRPDPLSLPVDAVGGEPVVEVTLTLKTKVPGAGSCQTVDLGQVGDPQTISLEMASPFLFHEDPAQVDDSESGGLGREEVFGGSWQHLDAVAAFNCGGSQPFSGKGWEGNYDSADYVDAETGSPAGAPSGVDLADVDEYCADGDCVNLHYVPTELRVEGRNVDEGDLIPFDFFDNNHSEFLGRLNPHHSVSGEEFRSSPFFNDAPVLGESFLRPRSPGQKPLVAAGASPLAKAINDFRCWYSEKRSGQCRNASYPKAWEQVARETIGNEAGCVQPYLIIVTDAENTCGGESPVADVAAMRSQANVRTWVIAMAPEGSASGQINAIPNVGKGELIYAENEKQLRETLELIRGIIEEEARTFASAAVPTVQATILDSIYISNFVPLNDASVWPGTVNAFLKPLPLDDQFRPDTTKPQHLWGTGDVILTQTGGLGPAADQRRVYYPPAVVDPDGDGLGARVLAGQLGEQRRFLEAPPAPANGDPATVAEKDLWRGLGLNFAEGDLSSEADARTDTADILTETYAVKTANVEGVGDVSFLHGDIFHSDPTVIGAPSNVRFFAGNLNGYRDFALQQENRRKVLLVGTNEGMLHVFDAGQAVIVENDVRFTNGTGRELFAFVPRTMLGEIRERAQTDAHDWGVDGSVKVADVFIDPAFSGAPIEDDREWRTVLVGGYRRGGVGYYALDLTQPEPVEEVPVGSPVRNVFVPEGTVRALDQDASDDPDDPIDPFDRSDPDKYFTMPECDGTTGTSSSLTCHGELQWPAPLWEFRDTRWNETLQQYVALDEEDTDDDGTPDGNPEPLKAHPDLARSWSIPNLGRIRICEGTVCLPSTDPDNPDDLVDRYVAIFGGGLPVSFGDWGKEGNFLYIVDVETGQGIYKRELVGSAPSEPAAVDTDNDGYLDRIYIGTTAGLMYRVDLVEFEVDGDGNRVQRPYPNLAPVKVRDLAGDAGEEQRIPLEDEESGLPIWEPKVIFDTLAPKSDTDSTPVRRPIFFRPSVLFVAELGKYALSFGTGDREDLWRPTDVEGRIYTFVDDSDVPTVALPMDESRLRRVDLLDVNIDVTDPNVIERNFLLDRTTLGTRGWVMTLDPKERVINESFALSGVSFFVSYTPRIETVSGECTREGDSRIFAVNTTNANGFLRDVDKNRVRFVEHKAFATSPYTEPGQTKNPPVGADERTADDLGLGTHLQEIMDELKTLFPANCKFGNYRIDVKTVLSDTGVVFVAPVPVCIIDKNWKEFDR